MRLGPSEKSKPILSCIGDVRHGPDRCTAPIINVPKHYLHTLLKIDFGLPAKFHPNLADVGPCAVGLPRAFGDVDRRRRTQVLDQLVHTDGAAASYVVDLANSAAL